jgi:hypothetical protein
VDGVTDVATLSVRFAGLPPFTYTLVFAHLAARRYREDRRDLKN